MINYLTLLSLRTTKTLSSQLLNIQGNTRVRAAFSYLFIGLAVLSYPLNVSAKTLLLLDQAGKPIVDAVIGIPAVTGTPNTSQDIAVMDQVDKQFLPRVLTIKQGQQVSFPNSDDIRHHVYSFSATKPFEIKLFKGAVNAPILFEKSGIVVLGCNIHDQMVGYIYVAQDEHTFISNAQGEVVLPDSASVINVWHANLSAQNTKRESVDIGHLPSTDGTVQLKLNLLGQQQDSEPTQPSTSKFKKKFN